MKKFLFIIGFLLASVPVANAQIPLDDCGSTLYENEFNCSALALKSYCSGSLIEDAFQNLETEIFPQFNIYRNGYCSTTRDNDDQVLAIVAAQMAVEDPLFDNVELIEFILTQLNDRSLVEFMEDSGLQKEDLPEPMRRTFFQSRSGENYGEQRRLHTKVKNLYEREKIMFQKAESLKTQFRNREVFYNATTNDSPFDLIVDLNLIEQVLFGSLAVWNDDPYSFPQLNIGSLDAPDDDSAPGIPTTPEPETEEGLPAEVAEEGAEVAESEEPITQYECVPDDEVSDFLDDLFGEDAEDTEEIEGSDAGAVPEGCGNSVVDGEEECDDGNLESGDGCSQECTLETWTSLSCHDPEAVTFHMHESDGDAPADDVDDTSDVGDEESDEDEIPISCPDGTTPVAVPPPGSELPDGSVVQPTGYPGPQVGGVLRQFPPSNRPVCSEGYSLTRVQMGNGEEFFDRCVPTPACADFDQLREVLYGEDYRDDPIKKKAAEAVEAIFCVEVTEVNRQASAYAENEGCIDCHIVAMTDIMHDLLGHQITPLENNMEAWGVSQRWGPTLSFDLSITVKALKNKIFPPKLDELTEAQEAELTSRQILQDAKGQLDPNENRPPPTTIANTTIAQLEADVKKYSEKAEAVAKEELKNYQATSEASTGDRLFHNDVLPMMKQMYSSFDRLQSNYFGLAASLKLHEKDKCE